MWRIIDDELRASDPPWDGLGDLRHNFVGLQGTLSWAMTQSTFDLVAPLPVRIEYPLTEEESGAMGIHVHEGSRPLAQEVALSLVGRYRDGSYLRRRIKPARTKDELELVLDPKQLPEKTASILIYGRVEVDRTNLFHVPNPRFTVFSEYVHIEELPSRLEVARGTILESWITIILQLLGFSPAHYGGVNELQAPDIVAFPPSENWFLVVEYTESDLDAGNKLSKLASRAKALTQALNGYSAHPIIVTTAARSMLNQTDLDKARTEKISVLTRDEFQDLIDLTIEEQGTSRVRDYILTLVPTVPPF